MLTYDQLTPAQQEKAVWKELEKLLEAVITDGIRFNDDLNDDDLQARIDAAIVKADRMRTPWFAHEYVMETCPELQEMALAGAMDTQYHLPGEHCQHLREV